MQMRCYRCGWSFAIKREEIAFAVESLEESGGNHYDARCPRCRHSNRISLEQLRRVAPPASEEEPAAEEE
jgi:phage FluMu protein Com